MGPWGSIGWWIKKKVSFATRRYGYNKSKPAFGN
jgi:hypothetical protein